MSSWVGKSIAHYRVSAKIGAGGMGEVYRASDSRLDRDVAIKLLPPEFANDPERMARFEREAKLLAALSHNNIAGIFGLEEADGSRALVMEMVEGPTLAERIAKGALPLDEALPIAKQIAEALEYAHERTIIHRDLKPANVKLAPDGVVKVLDYGLAKALSDDMTGSDSDLSRSPTLTAASTRLGVILGTAAYMSPEQAKGKAVDRRADIWAFGAVLMEMLTGRQTFAGETVSETLASVMKDEPDWSTLPASTPARIRDLIRRCLVKDPKQRLRDIGDARIRIEEVISGAPEAAGEAGGSGGVSRRRVSALPIALLAVAIGAGAGYWLRPPARPPLVQATLTFPEGMELNRQDVSIALSPDGRTVAIAATASGDQPRIWLRHLDRADAVALAGTEGAAYPFWSPDGRYVGFFADRKLKRVPAAGGVVQNLCDVTEGRGASWGSKGMIVFSPGPLDGLNIVPAAGGVSRAVTTLDSTGATHRLPCFLPDGKRVLFASGATTFAEPTIECLDLDTGQRTRVMTCQSGVRYIEGGNLAFLLDNNLVVQRFDPSSLELSGDPIPLAENVEFNLYRYAGNFDLHPGGALVYASSVATESLQPTWFDFEGNELGKIGVPAGIFQHALSPDGRRLLTCERAERFDLWMTDMTTGVRTRFTFGPDPAAFPVWARDGRTVYYGTGAGKVFAKGADGASAPRVILDIPKGSFWPGVVSPDGKSLTVYKQVPSTGIDIDLLSLEGDAAPRPLINGAGNQGNAAFSPDGRWLAYVAGESGRNEVIVVPFPSLAGRWQISSQGGESPQWLPDGRGILYSTPDGHLLRADVDGRGEGLLLGGTTPVFGGRVLPGDYSVSRDGKRVLVMVPEGGAATLTLNLITDWRQLLGARDSK